MTGWEKEDLLANLGRGTDGDKKSYPLFGRGYKIHVIKSESVFRRFDDKHVVEKNVLNAKLAVFREPRRAKIYLSHSFFGVRRIELLSSEVMMKSLPKIEASDLQNCVYLAIAINFGKRFQMKR